jgi:hypothetical protein
MEGDGMKIQTFIPIQASFGRITEAGNDKQGGAGSNAYERQKKQEKKDDPTPFSAEALEEAIESFSVDETNLTHGISASSEGSGPGLRVLLKDGTGGILRAVSGEEFLRLREAIHSGSKSGRLLDQKV